MSGKRANGEGNIRKRADGRWEGRYTVGHDPATGKQIIRNVLGKSQAEARVKLAAAIQQTAGLDILRAKQYTVETWIQYWLDHYGKINLRPSTHSSYSGMLRGHIQPDIGSIKLTKLRTTDLQRFYSKLLADGNIANTKKENRSKGLKPESVRRIHFFISTTLEKAVAEKLIYLNPAKACTLPKKEHTEMKTLPLDKINVFFKEAKNSSIYEMLLLEMVTGLRKGELIGLKWTDVDYDTGMIKIQRQICKIDGTLTESPLKTKNAYRKIVIPADVTEVLRNKQKKDAGASEYIFFSPSSGGPVSPGSVVTDLHRVLDRAGLPRVRFHDLRHTFATMALQNGVDVKTLSNILGHFSAAFTLDTYAHVTASMQQDAANKVGAFLNKYI